MFVRVIATIDSDARDTLEVAGKLSIWNTGQQPLQSEGRGWLPVGTPLTMNSTIDVNVEQQEMSLIPMHVGVAGDGRVEFTFVSPQALPGE